MSAPIQGESGEFRSGDRHDVPARSEKRGRHSFYFVMVRVTGLMLAILVLGHFALTHIVTDVAETGAEFIDQRWGSALWLLWDWAMLTAALLHGAAGVSISIEDYTPDSRKRKRRQRLLVLISTLLFVLGLTIIVLAALS
ncbi:MAG: succinate dehydrogenase hydrophobic membrane anchor protein [Actinomycetota bacterium]|nr:succinate dehydrogenase hydrophobic membrane anchor protein [Actinomycetota bacterium]